MSGRGGKRPGQIGHFKHTAAHRLQARLAIQKINAEWHAKPKCGAHARSTGEPCRQLALANGRCRFHGGVTGKAKEWGLPRWPKDEAKLNAKLRDREKAARRRERRIAAMTPDERAAYDRWKKARKPGSPEARAAAREELRQAREARARLKAGDVGKPRSPELQELHRMIAVLKRSMADRDPAPADAELTNEIDRGAFG